MTPVPANRTLIANGEYGFADAANQVPTGVYGGKMAFLELDGDFGGGTATLGYEGESGNFVPYRDDAGAEIETLVPYGRQVGVPISGIVAVKLAGATAPALKVSLIACKP
jgi:hypothetical protein